MFIDNPVYHSQAANHCEFAFLIIQSIHWPAGITLLMNLLVFRLCYQSIKFRSIESFFLKRIHSSCTLFICCILLSIRFMVFIRVRFVFILSCSPRAFPTKTSEKNYNKNRAFCWWQIERVNEHIITDFVETSDEGETEKVVTATITTLNGAKSTQSRDMCTHAATSHKTECDLNIYELECELIEWAEWEWARQWIKMWCDNATNHHMECSERCERASVCVRACLCINDNVYTLIHMYVWCVCTFLMSTSNWMLNRTHYTIHNERADFSLN